MGLGRLAAGSAAALGFPGAGAAAAGPRAGARVAGESAGAVGALVAVADQDLDGAIAADLAGDRDGARAIIEESALGDAHRIAVGAVAGSLFGDDHDAPEAVVVRGGGRRVSGAKRARERDCDERQG